MMQLISEQTDIPVPRVIQVARDPELRESYLEMEYIDGVDLEDMWPSANWWKRLKILWALRCYVRQLRRLKVPNPEVPGPIHPDGAPLACLPPDFSEDGAGPFNSYKELAIFFDTMRTITLVHSFPRVKEPTPFPLFDATYPLVFTHADIHGRNVRIGPDGTVWLLDWTNAGIFPLYYEYSLIRRSPGVLSSPWIAWFIAGRYARQHQFFINIKFGAFSSRGAFRYDLSEPHLLKVFRRLLRIIRFLTFHYVGSRHVA